MRNRKFFTLLSFSLFLIVLLTGCNESKPTRIETPLERGQALFSNQCAMCHGMQGEGQSMMLAGRNIHFNEAQWQKRLSDAEIMATLKNGRGNMPSFTLNAEEETAILAYIRSLGTESK